jgi:predicted component of type VI protein secretion system
MRLVMTTTPKAHPVAMSILRLTARITDLRTGSTVVRSFFRSPVTVGRRDGNALRLDSKKVSAYHGAFAFGRSSLRYVDCGSRNGTRIDGVPVLADVPLHVNDASDILIGPFRLAVHLHEIFSSDALDLHEVETPSDTRPTTNGMNNVAAILATHSQNEALQWVLSRWTPSQLLARALLVFEIFAEVAVEFRPQILATEGSPLRSAMRAEEVIVYLLDPSGGDESLEELLTYLLELAHADALGYVRGGSS